MTQGAGSFDGGTLTASFVTNGRSSDQLALITDGDGIGQINMVGDGVQYEGLAVGSLSGGADGEPLVITFNGAATARAVEAVAEHLSYRTTSAGPLPSRTLGLVLQDGSGANVVPERGHQCHPGRQWRQGAVRCATGEHLRRR